MVTQELKNREELDEVGGPAFITQLTRRVASAAHLEFHARIIAQKYIQRELIRVSSEIQAKSYDDTMDVDDLIDFFRVFAVQCCRAEYKRKTLPIKPVLNQAIIQIEKARQRERWSKRRTLRIHCS